MDIFSDILNAFNPISLKQMDKVKLLNRTDTKYVVSVNTLPEIFDEIKDQYLVLEINNQRLFSYESLYFDTDDLKMYTTHHNGKLNRFKIRKREYIDSKLNFLEIKYKNNKGRTNKERISGEEMSHGLSETAKEFIRKNSPFDPDYLIGQIFTIFNRFTLVNVNLTERITIDLDVRFKNHASSAGFPNISIIEIKQDRLTNNSLLTDKLREMKILPAGFSKYCFGTIMTNDWVKKNNFKPRLLKINKLENA